MKKTAIVLWIFAIAVPLTAQTPSGQVGAMKKLDFMLGQWQGEGWIEFAPGQRRTFSQTETVQSKLSGLLVVVDGLGKSKDPGREGAVIHQAYAVTQFDESSKQYRWRAYTAEGRSIDTELKLVGEGTVQWEINVPGRNIRFTMNLSQKDQWLETGEMSQDGTNWLKFFEMTLKRMK